jgi:hypothetical protein
MFAEIKMTINERRKYLMRMRLFDVQGNRRRKSHLLDKMEEVTELHRRSLVRLMKAEPVRKSRLRQRGRTYDHDLACFFRKGDTATTDGSRHGDSRT